MILLDTHVWLWWLLGDERLGKDERKILDQHARDREIAISAATLWEAEALLSAGKLQLQTDPATWFKKATSEAVCTVVPIDLQVILAQQKLPSNFPDDPADKLIVATSIEFDYPLATKDRRLQSMGF